MMRVAKRPRAIPLSVLTKKSKSCLSCFFII